MGKHVVGNWKMHGSTAMVETLVSALAASVPEGAFREGGRVTLCPPFPYLTLVARLLADTRIELGAQNSYPAGAGAFTGEVSPSMLKDCGVNWCLAGHSERRQLFGEQDSFVRKKLEALMTEGIRPILCVGETLSDRQAGRQEAVVGAQLDAALEGLPAPGTRRLTVAYEPIWAIGTGHNATPQQAHAMHGFIRKRIAERTGGEVAAAIPILYGGSVNPGNVRHGIPSPSTSL